MVVFDHRKKNIKKLNFEVEKRITFRRESDKEFSRRRTLMIFRNYQLNLVSGEEKNELGGFNLWLGQTGD